MPRALTGANTRCITINQQTTRRPVPRWVYRAATVVPLTVLPSSLWRLALGLGVPVGFTGALARMFAAPGWITLYVILLGLISESFALLTPGLVRRWGEVVPSWLPGIGGRRVPVPAAVLPALTGAAALIALSVVSALNWNGPQNNGDPDAPHGVAGLVMTACYAPMLAWGPLVAVVAIAYWIRRSPERQPGHGSPPAQD